jgi:carboxyl-terminal processing protease
MDNQKPSPKYLLPLALFIFLAVGIWIGVTLAPGNKGNSLSTGEERYGKVKDIIDILNTKYVDSVNADKLFEETISDMLHKLDPHSNYITPQEMRAQTEQIQGEFGGIGVRFTLLRDTICVTNVVPNSPSLAAGVKAGDKIIVINGKNVASKHITNEGVMKSLKGPQNTEVKLVLYRNKQKITKRLVRGTIPIGSVLASYMMNGSTGFIKIDQFSVTTAEEFRVASQKLKRAGMKNLILDLRNNGGGVLQSAVEIVDEFLKNGAVIVKTKGVHLKEQVYKATSKGELEQTKVVVLINSNSASASEIVAGALQDNDRATIMGRRSFGKGLVQEDILLKDGSDIRLTIARYYTPTGRCIQKPYTDDYDAYMSDQISRLEHGEQYKADTSLFVDSLRFKTPKGKVVYGGGGIFPDVFIPLDTLGSSWYFTDLRYGSAFQNFAFDFVANKRNSWSNVAAFVKQFQVDENLVTTFVKYAEKNNLVKIDPKGLAISKSLIKQTLKAEIARQIWTEDGFYAVINSVDKEVIQALKYFK